MGSVFLKVRLAVCDPGPCEPETFSTGTIKVYFRYGPILSSPLCKSWACSEVGEEWGQVESQVCRHTGKWGGKDGSSNDKLTSFKPSIGIISFNPHNLKIGTIINNILKMSFQSHLAIIWLYRVGVKRGKTTSKLTQLVWDRSGRVAPQCDQFATGWRSPGLVWPRNWEEAANSQHHIS